MSTGPLTEAQQHAALSLLADVLADQDNPYAEELPLSPDVTDAIKTFLSGFAHTRRWEPNADA